MKNIFALLLIFLMFFLMACSGETTVTPISTQGSSETVASTESSTVSEKAVNKSEPVLESIQSELLFEWEGIKVTSKEIVNDDIWGKGLKVLIENDSEINATIQLNHIVVNNYMISNLFSTTVAAGKKANETIDLSTPVLETSGIDVIGEIALSFMIMNSDSYDRLFDSEEIVIKTSENDSMEIVSLDEGKELLNFEGIKVVGKYVEENTIWGTGVQLFIENQRDDNVIVQCENMSINGFMVSPYFSSTVNSGRYAMDSITVFASDLEENDIESVEEIELVFRVLDADSYSTIFESEPIEFSVK